VSTPTDRLPYADCAYIEATLSAGNAGIDAIADAADHARDPVEPAASCPRCGSHRRPVALSVEALDVLQFRFWSADHRQFDHIGFARAVIAACTE
jgi:hypothetical protein